MEHRLLHRWYGNVPGSTDLPQPQHFSQSERDPMFLEHQLYIGELNEQIRMIHIRMVNVRRQLSELNNDERVLHLHPPSQQDPEHLHVEIRLDREKLEALLSDLYVQEDHIFSVLERFDTR